MTKTSASLFYLFGPLSCLTFTMFFFSLFRTRESHHFRPDRGELGCIPSNDLPRHPVKVSVCGASCDLVLLCRLPCFRQQNGSSSKSHQKQSVLVLAGIEKQPTFEIPCVRDEAVFSCFLRPKLLKALRAPACRLN